QNVRRLNIRPVCLNGTRLDRSKLKLTGLICRNAAKSNKCIVERLNLRLNHVPTGAIRVPDLKNRVRHGRAIRVKYSSRDFDNPTWDIRIRQIVPVECFEADLEVRAYCLVASDREARRNCQRSRF